MRQRPVTDCVAATHSTSLVVAVLVILAIADSLSSARAAITSTGSINLADLADWNSSTDGYVGYAGDGLLDINSASQLESHGGIIAYEQNTTAVVTVNGRNSAWTLGDMLDVGYKGYGRLNVTDGGLVSNVDGYIGTFWSRGVATVSGNGSTWINSSALAVGGHHGYGTLNIVNGGAVADGVGSIASASYSTGTVSVNGRDSKWTNDSSLYVGVGDQSDGRMNIANGSFVGCNDGYIGYYPGSKGQVNVEGSDSKWSINSSLCVGQSGRGSLYVMGGGTVEATSVSIGGIGSLLAIDVGRNSSIAVDDGAIGLANNNAVRFVAGTGAEAGKSYTPISAHTWTTGPYGVYQAVGGTWDATAHTFTASAIKLGTSGNAVTIDLANEQRVLISDSATGWSVGASFLASSTPASLDFTATAVTGDTLNLLKNQLGIGESVLSSWAFLAKGYTVSSNNPVYLSLKIGSGHVMDDLDLWHYGTNGWTAYSPTDLTYDGTYASFTVTSFSGYAVTGIAVPEPSGAVLLLATAVGLAGYAWRKRWIGR